MKQFRAQELRESGRGRPAVLVHNSSYGLCGRKAPLNYLKKKAWVFEEKRHCDRLHRTETAAVTQGGHTTTAHEQVIWL